MMRKVFSKTDPIIFRLSGGRFTTTGPVLITCLVLTTTGKNSGRKRSVQLVYTDVGGAAHVVASNFGGEKHPAWSHNLMANPKASVERDGKTIPVQAVRLSDLEKADVWDILVASVPNYAVYKSRTDRNIKVYRLEQCIGA